LQEQTVYFIDELGGVHLTETNPTFSSSNIVILRPFLEQHNTNLYVWMVWLCTLFGRT